MVDITIIGAGIVGSFIAHYLSQYELKVLLLEKEVDVCSGVSKANSAIIHAGNDPQPNTLKAKLNLQGNKMYDVICETLNVRLEKVGSLTVATNEEEIQILNELYERAIQNGVDVSLLNRNECLEKEPNLSENVLRGLYADSTKIISPWEMVYALLENAIYNGVTLKVNEEVLDIKEGQQGFKIITQNENYETRYIINCAGLFAKKIYEMVCEDPEFDIIPKRGQYYVLDKEARKLVNGVIYPIPSEKGKGVLVIPTIDGNILLGPTSEVISSLDNTNTTKDGFTYIRHHVKSMMQNIPYKSVIHAFSGIRPKSNINDFIIEESKVKNFINVCGIDSPGLASAPAIGQMVLEILLEKEEFVKKVEYEIYRQKYIRIDDLTIEEKNDYIKKNPQYGQIVCRCEQVSLGEIMDAIKRPLGAKTVDGVKRRCRSGMGRCQGGFCSSQIVDILSKELGISHLDVLLEGKHSELLKEETKRGECYE